MTRARKNAAPKTEAPKSQDVRKPEEAAAAEPKTMREKNERDLSDDQKRALNADALEPKMGRGGLMPPLADDPEYVPYDVPPALDTEELPEDAARRMARANLELAAREGVSAAIIGRVDLAPEVRLVALALHVRGPMRVPELRKASGLPDPDVVQALRIGRLKRIVAKGEDGCHMLGQVAR